MSTPDIESHTFNLAVENIDTDQIIPAHFLTTTGREGLGQACFHAWRFNEDGSEKADNPLREHNVQVQKVLVTGENFGCGSSREHAPWALLDYGFKAVISSRFADIFSGNALKNGLLPVVVKPEVSEYLLAHPDSEVSIDVGSRKLVVNGYGEFEFPLDPFSAYCLMRGIDQLDFILQGAADIKRYEQSNGK